MLCERYATEIERTYNLNQIGKDGKHRVLEAIEEGDFNEYDVRRFLVNMGKDGEDSEDYTFEKSVVEALENYFSYDLGNGDDGCEYYIEIEEEERVIDTGFYY